MIEAFLLWNMQVLAEGPGKGQPFTDLHTDTEHSMRGTPCCAAQPQCCNSPTVPALPLPTPQTYPLMPGLFNGVEVVSGEACLYTESFIYAQVDRRLQGTARSMVSMHGKAPVGGWCILCRGVKGGSGGASVAK